MSFYSVLNFALSWSFWCGDSFAGWSILCVRKNVWFLATKKKNCNSMYMSLTLNSLLVSSTNFTYFLVMVIANNNLDDHVRDMITFFWANLSRTWKNKKKLLAKRRYEKINRNKKKSRVLIEFPEVIQKFMNM
jgi:hypothetical protein